jgi:hypothetical protein
MQVTYENVGNTFFSVLLRETSDRSPSGTRTTLANSAVMLAPGGQQTISTTTKGYYLEVLCTGTTEGQLRMQIDSQRQWNQLAFDRLDSYQYNKLWQAKEVPGAYTP